MSLTDLYNCPKIVSLNVDVKSRTQTKVEKAFSCAAKLDGNHCKVPSTILVTMILPKVLTSL